LARILIVEDEPSISMVLQEVLTDEGHETMAVVDGFEALKWLQEQGQPPDIVLVDLFMPRLSGKAIVEAMRNDIGLQNVPVILVTGAVPSVHDYPPEGSYQDIIGKPFDVVDVLQKVNQLVQSA